MNRRRAQAKLQAALGELRTEAEKKDEEGAWRAAKTLERGNPTRIYVGPEFLLKEPRK